MEKAGRSVFLDAGAVLHKTTPSGNKTRQLA
jgi:hypothetical protein